MKDVILYDRSASLITPDLAPRKSRPYRDWQKISWLGQRARIQQGDSRPKKDVEATQHLVTVALSLSTTGVTDLWFFLKWRSRFSAPVEEGLDARAF